MIPTIGIIGGIGSGKSVVADAMQKLGGHLIAADQLGHDALKQADIKAKVVERWSDQILDNQGNPDRRKIAGIVFSSLNELRALESLVFPYIEQRIVEEMAVVNASSDEKFIILDAAILLETGWRRHCDKIVFVEAPRAAASRKTQGNAGLGRGRGRPPRSRADAARRKAAPS